MIQLPMTGLIMHDWMEMGVEQSVFCLFHGIIQALAPLNWLSKTTEYLSQGTLCRPRFELRTSRIQRSVFLVQFLPGPSRSSGHISHPVPPNKAMSWPRHSLSG
jgi:hypothetical protein